MQLVHIDTQKEAQVGDTVYSKDEAYTIAYFLKPHKPSSEGLIDVLDDNKNDYCLYVGVVGLEWINREDRL